MGYSIATSILSAARSQALTDLATVKSELGLSNANTAHDAWLARAITQVARSIRTHTQRGFAPEMLRDRFDIDRDAYPAQTPGGFAQLPLSRWPVIAIGAIAEGSGAGSQAALAEDRDYRLDAETGQLLRLNRFSGTGTRWDAMPVSVDYVAGYGALAEASETVPAIAPYTIAKDDWCCDFAVALADGTPLARAAGIPGTDEYSVAGGVYTFPLGLAGAGVSIRYAVAAIPEDLEEVCLRLITARFKAKDRDPALVQRDTPGVGTERWWFGGAPGQKGPFPPDITAMLEPYCAAVVA